MNKQRHPIRDRREVAALYQLQKLKVHQIVAKGYEKCFVHRWKQIDYLSPDSAFADRKRRKPTKLTAQQRKRAAKRLEKDTKNVVINTAAHVGVSRATMYRIAAVECDKKKCEREVVLSPNSVLRREEFSISELGANHSVNAYADHTVVEIPPMSTQKHVWRVKGSKKAVPTRKKWKNRTKMMIYLASAEIGNSDAMFNVIKKRCKKRRRGETKLRYRWETYNINAAEVKKDLEATVFPWMRKNNLTKLYLDNAPCQDGLRQFILDAGVDTPGFASLRRSQAGGFPANSPDFMMLDSSVFPVFKQEFSRRCPTTIPAAMRVTRDILKDLDKVGSRWVQHLDSLYSEVIAKKGGASHLLK